jgi:hypothetical protein
MVHGRGYFIILLTRLNHHLVHYPWPWLFDYRYIGGRALDQLPNGRA